MIIYDPIIINKTKNTLKWYYKNGNIEEYKKLKYSQFRKKINLNETLIDVLIDAKCKQVICVLEYLNDRQNGSKIVVVSKGNENGNKSEFNYVSEAYNSYENPIKIVRKSKKLLFIDSQFNTPTAEIKRLENDVEFDFFATSMHVETEQNELKGVNSKIGDNEKLFDKENDRKTKEDKLNEESNCDC